MHQKNHASFQLVKSFQEPLMLCGSKISPTIVDKTYFGIVLREPFFDLVTME